MIRKDWKSEMFYEVTTTAKWMIPLSHWLMYTSIRKYHQIDVYIYQCDYHMMQAYILSCNVCLGIKDFGADKMLPQSLWCLSIHYNYQSSMCKLLWLITSWSPEPWLLLMKNLTSQKMEDKKNFYFSHDDWFSDIFQKLLIFSLGDYIVFLGLKSIFK